MSETVSGPATPGPILPECFDRTFSISPGAVAPQFDDYENPTAITYNGSVPIQYGVVPASGDNPIGLRIPSKVNGIQSDLGIIVQPMNGPTPVLGAQYPLPFNSSSITGGTYYQPNGGSTTPTFTGNFTGNETDTLTESDPAAFEASYTIPTADLIGGSDSSKAFHYGDEVCAALVVDPGSYQMDATGKITVDNGSVATNPPQVCSKPLAAEPYLKAYGGDVSAGTTGDVDMDIGCNPADDVGDICSWNKGGTSSYAGAGTELAAFAFNVIDGFASAQNVSQTGLSPLPLGLTFANNPSGNFDYGGDFGANSSNNTANYFTQGSTAANTVTSTSASLALTMAQTMRASIGNPVNIAFSVPGGGIIGSESGPPIVIQPDYNITIYSNGPITIASNISYGGPLTNNPADMPNLEIVTNNAPINIDSTVTQLAGVYVAEGAGGIIDDCADQASTPTSWFTDCNQKLTVNGSFTANALDLDRTYDSLHQATPTEISGSSNAAEEFNYSPIVWLTYPNQNVSPVVQAVTSLPPIL